MGHWVFLVQKHGISTLGCEPIDGALGVLSSNKYCYFCLPDGISSGGKVVHKSKIQKLADKSAEEHNKFTDFLFI